MKNIKFRILLFLIILITTLTILLNCPPPDNSSSGGGNGSSSTLGLYDTTFNNGGSGINFYVRSIAIQSNGKILVGGIFTHYNGVDVPDGLVRLNANGSYDSTFNNGGYGIDAGELYSIAIQADGKILIGGFFTNYNGIDVPDYIIRLNTDGSYDTTFNNGGIGANSTVYSITVQSDGKILIGGDFTSYNGVNVPRRIIRLNTNGSYDSTFNTGNSGTNTVYSIAVQSDGKILIGGIFTHYNGVDVPDRFTRLYASGTEDPTFNNGGIGANGTVYSIAVQSDGKILIGGSFILYNNINVPDGIIRLNADGSYDTTFNNGGTGTGIVYSIVIQSDRKILIGGHISHYNGVDVPNDIIRLNADGSHDPTFNSGGYGVDMDGEIYSIAIQSDGKILIGGWFYDYNGVDVPDGIIRLYN